MGLKRPSTVEEQIEILKSHNIIINDEEEAAKILRRVSYYRLSGYMLQYRLSTNDSLCKDGTKSAIKKTSRR